ncbi:MAG: putative rane protein [Herbinix sp.]|nr:putative rane protein [Herbinix sp.]
MDSFKRITVLSNLVLLAWFFLDMVGLSFGNNILVTRSYKEDGIYFIIFAVAVILFILKEKVGKYILLIWLSLWFTTQFYSHWYITILGPWERLRTYFVNTIKLIPTKNIYIPDLYHIVLHLLILVSFISLIVFLISSKKKNINM